MRNNSFPTTATRFLWSALRLKTPAHTGSSARKGSEDFRLTVTRKPRITTVSAPRAAHRAHIQIAASSNPPARPTLRRGQDQLRMAHGTIWRGLWKPTALSACLWTEFTIREKTSFRAIEWLQLPTTAMEVFQ